MQLRLLLNCGYRTSPLQVMPIAEHLHRRVEKMRGLESVKIRTILATLEGYCLLTRTGLGESIGIEPTTHRL